MLNFSFLPCFKPDCRPIVVNGEKFSKPAMTLTLIRYSTMSNSLEFVSYTTTYLSWKLLELLFFDCFCTRKDKQAHIQTDMNSLLDEAEKTQL